MSTFHFCKMQSLGNDFMIIDGLSESIDVAKLPIAQLAHRQLGVGFDQLLWIKSSDKADFSCVIFNADGSEAEQCGNGMRCIARYLHEEKLIDKKSVSIDTKAGVIEALIHDYDRIEVNMGLPRFEPHEIPFDTDQMKNLYELSLDSKHPKLALSILSMGNPHAVLKVDSIREFPVESIAPLISTHRLFPRGVNVGFMEVISPKHIRLRTFERGAGETLACGSNACAAVVAGVLNHSLDSEVKVEFTLGELLVKWNGKNSSVILTGPANRIFSGDVFFGSAI
jgi:diaminopimelate epimerase